MAKQEASNFKLPVQVWVLLFTIIFVRFIVVLWFIIRSKGIQLNLYRIYFYINIFADLYALVLKFLIGKVFFFEGSLLSFSKPLLFF